ncbi:hypothetical protein BUALT_Bualt01G0188700 [Buddleja alternifolia]|uniref:DUF8040 domain-containing protein n=1 Tax=Buddleja alternifolia TaxID=168488 RepID=A0AAV6Y898_9LAMI|nr:hypothetical protein BUALT_Bualt01G0188700 [Buddleja alternifolia]
MLVDEQVAMTVHILAHHQKQRIINANFERSAETISRHFRKVINAIIRIQDELLKKPDPVPDNSTDERWKWLKMDTLTQDIRGRDKNKRKWKYEEDAKFIEALLDMANLGTYKPENGFKPGYLNCVEEKMQSHPSHSSWQNKSFPFYEDLLIIFGKDRATGTNAEGPADMIEEIQREQVNNNANTDVEEHGLEDIDASMQSPINEGLHNQKKKKKSRSEDNMTVMMGGIKDATSVIGNEIAKASEVFRGMMSGQLQRFEKVGIVEGERVVDRR